MRDAATCPWAPCLYPLCAEHGDPDCVTERRDAARDEAIDAAIDMQQETGIRLATPAVKL